MQQLRASVEHLRVVGRVVVGEGGVVDLEDEPVFLFVDEVYRGARARLGHRLHICVVMRCLQWR